MITSRSRTMNIEINSCVIITVPDISSTKHLKNISMLRPKVGRLLFYASTVEFPPTDMGKRNPTGPLVPNRGGVILQEVVEQWHISGFVRVRALLYRHSQHLARTKQNALGYTVNTWIMCFNTVQRTRTSEMFYAPPLLSGRTFCINIRGVLGLVWRRATEKKEAIPAIYLEHQP